MIVSDQVFAMFISPAGSVFWAELAVSSVYIEMAYVPRLWVERLEVASGGPWKPCLAFLFCSENGIMLTNNYGIWVYQENKMWQHQSYKMIMFGLEEWVLSVSFHSF